MLSFSLVSSLFLMFSFCSCPLIPLSFPLVPHFPHSPFSISFLLLLLLAKLYPIMTFLLWRSWDTPRQRWERIREELNLDLCFTLKQWNSSRLWINEILPCPLKRQQRGWTGCFVCRSVSLYQCVSVFVVVIDHILLPTMSRWIEVLMDDYCFTQWDCQWQGHWFNDQVLPIALISALSLISALQWIVGSELKAQVRIFWH